MKLFKAAGLAMAISIIGLSVVSDVAALPAVGYVYTYYSDASHTNPVGNKWLFCNGAHGASGVVTAYAEKEDIQCSQPGGGDYSGPCAYWCDGW